MPAVKNSPYRTPEFGQAQHIIDKFGGESVIAALLGMDRTAVYRWNYVGRRGTNGLVPSAARMKLSKLARMEGVLLTESDWDLRPNTKSPTFHIPKPL